MPSRSLFGSDLDPSQFVTPTASQMVGSRILGIATQVRGMQAQGREICNLTVGDFRPELFPIPQDLAIQAQEAYSAGQTNYPPADGIPELKKAVSDLYRNVFGLDYGPEGVCVASGARPPLYATWKLFVSPGDVTVSFLPAWNVGYYAHLFGSNHRFVPTSASSNFHPTIEQIEAILPEARLILLNSPLNPTGTLISSDVLEGIAKAVVEENRRRAGKPPVMIMFDQVYWMLTEPGFLHSSPVSLVPEVAPYVIHIDAISKCFAATGLRVGWAVLPPFLQPKMKALIGHMGAWAARPEQLATAWLLSHPDRVQSYMEQMRERVGQRLQKIYQGVMGMKERGLPVDAIAPQGAIYLSFRMDLARLGFSSNEDMREWLLEAASVAVVPFQAFDLMDESGWFRMSVGSVGLDELDGALQRIEDALRSRLA
jgi:aspartate aminotransferase